MLLLNIAEIILWNWLSITGFFYFFRFRFSVLRTIPSRVFASHACNVETKIPFNYKYN